MRDWLKRTTRFWRDLRDSLKDPYIFGMAMACFCMVVLMGAMAYMLAMGIEF